MYTYLYVHVYVYMYMYLYKCVLVLSRLFLSRLVLPCLRMIGGIGKVLFWTYSQT